MAVSQGEVTVARSELLKDVVTASDGKVGASVVLAPLNLPWLSNIAKAFERVRWHSARIEYRPAVGANTDGTVAVGFDWGSTDVKSVEGNWQLVAAIDKPAVLSCTPNIDMPVWQRATLSIPNARLQSRAWYDLPKESISTIFDEAPGTVVYAAQSGAGKTVGELWLHYRVQLSGTRKV